MKKNVKRLIAGAVVLLVAAGIVVRIAGGNKKEEEYETRPTVAVENPKTGDITLYTDLTGTIEPISKAVVQPKIGGELLEVNFQAGDPVEAGQVLCKIDSDALTALQLQMQSASVAADNAARELARIQPLYASGYISQQQFDQAQSSATSARLAYESAKNQYDLPDYSQVMDGYGKIFEDIKAGRIISAYAVEGKGLAEAVSKMAFGNKLGVKIEHNVDPRDFFAAAWGDIVCEVPDGMVGQLSIPYTVIGEVTDRSAFEYGNVTIAMDEALDAWMTPLEDVFPTATGKEAKGDEAALEEKLYHSGAVYVCDHKIGQPTVFIPVFPGTNCEYDSARAFERAGAKVVTRVLRNMSAGDIRQSVDEYRREIAKAQIVMFPGGFSAGDEPEGSAKFFATVFRNAVMKEEIEKLLGERDGLMLGICNGFQALIKLGLLLEGEIKEQGPDSPTLAMNTIGRHVSKMVYTKVVSDKSPWLAGAVLGSVYCNPASHGEGRFVANESWLHRLFANGQVATQYVDDQGRCTMDEYWNPNGSYMAIEGITSPDGRILGKMAHSERRGEAVAMNIYGEQDMKIFESGVKYFEL